MASLTNNPAVMDMSHLSFTRPQFTKLAKSIRSSIAEKVVAYNKEHFGDNNTSVDKFQLQPSYKLGHPTTQVYLISTDENISQDDLVDEQRPKDPWYFDPIAIAKTY